MSNHISENAYTKAQMQEAWQEAADDTLSHTRPTFVAFMAALNKPAIHPDVVVLCDVEEASDMAMEWKRAKMDPRATNVRVLLPANTIMKKARERDEYLKEFGGHRIHSDERYWATAIADYTKNGPGHDDVEVDYEVVDE